MVLCQHVGLLNTKRLVLASASPRRSELLRTLGLTFEVRASNFDETLDKSAFKSAADYASATALQKALEVAAQPCDDGQLADLVIGADTVVDVSGDVLEKPEGPAGAESMLLRLSGTRHCVHTGVALVFPRAKRTPVTFSETTHVTFAKLSPQTIQAYIATGEPFGKAGAYGIQGVAGSFVAGIEGCYFNVVGLPLHRLCSALVPLIEDDVL